MQGSANLNLMIKAARRVGRSLVKDFREVENLQVSAKGPGDFVSRADREAERILRAQRELNLRFGDAAIHLGLLSEADIRQALSRQFDYPYLARGEAALADEVLGRNGRMVEAVRSIGRGADAFEGTPFSLSVAPRDPRPVPGRA